MTNIKLREKLTEVFELEVFELIGGENIHNEYFGAESNLFLGCLLDEDYFGTEGQCDPRKDWRNDVIGRYY